MSGLNLPKVPNGPLAIDHWQMSVKSLVFVKIVIIIKSDPCQKEKKDPVKLDFTKVLESSELEDEKLYLREFRCKKCSTK